MSGKTDQQGYCHNQVSTYHDENSPNRKVVYHSITYGIATEEVSRDERDIKNSRLPLGPSRGESITP